MKYQFIKFIVIGIINTSVYYILFSIFIYLEFDYKLAVLFATVVTTFVSFYNFGKHVFTNTDKKLFLRFLSNTVFIFTLNIVLLRYIDMYTSNLYLSGFLALIPLTVLSYLINKFYVFR